MVLVSLLLVLAAAVALVIGLLQSGLAIIYVSIGCSVVAGILLAVAVVRGRPEKPTGPMPRPASGAPAAPPPPPAQTWQEAQPAPEPVETERVPAMAGRGRGRTPIAQDSTQQLDQAAIEQAVEGDSGDDLPIPDYDRLRATEVLPLLASLDADQLAEVRRHESAGRNRFMVLSRIDRELEARGPSEWDAGEGWDDGEKRSDDDDDSTAVEVGDAQGADEERADDEELEAERADDEEEEPAAAPTPVLARGRAGPGLLENYEQLKVLEILPRLSELSADELAQVRRREQAGQRRAMILNRVDRLIVDAPRVTPAESRRTPARKAPARKIGPSKAPRKAAGKAPAKKAAAKKAAGTKAPAAKAPAGKAAATKAPAKRAPAKKAARKAAAAKTPARKATPTEQRAGSVKKTTAKKSAKRR